MLTTTGVLDMIINKRNRERGEKMYYVSRNKASLWKLEVLFSFLTPPLPFFPYFASVKSTPKFLTVNHDKAA